MIWPFTEHISVHGPITQSQFLGYLGINFRVEALLQNCTEEQAESLKTGYWQLVGDGEAPFWEGPNEQTPVGMGNRYLAMAIVNKKQGVPVPFEWKVKMYLLVAQIFIYIWDIICSYKK